MAQLLGDLFVETQIKLSAAARTNNKMAMQECCIVFNEILNKNPNDALIIFTVATTFHMLGWNGAAINLFLHLIRNGVTDSKVLNNLGTCYKAENMDEEARKIWEELIQKSPSTEVYNNLSTLFINKGNAKWGINYARKAIELDAWNADAHWNLALLLLEDGRWSEGMKEYEAGLAANKRGILTTSAPWMGEPLEGKSILITGEQGIGDEIMFMEALRDLHPDKLYIECHDRLEGMVKRNFPNVEVIPTRKSLDKANLPKTDYVANIGSLFYRLRPHGEFNKIPYLSTNREKVFEYKQMLMKLGPPPYVGIAYDAGHKSTHGHVRSFKLTTLKPILQQKATFISLQYTKDASRKWEQFYKDTGIKVHHFPDIVESHTDEDYKEKAKGYDYDETFSLIGALDLCIVPCTAAVHVCGSIGKECWVLTPKQKAWRYHGSEHMRMYGDHVKLFHERDGWERTIQSVAKKLEGRCV